MSEIPDQNVQPLPDLNDLRDKILAGEVGVKAMHESDYVDDEPKTPEELASIARLTKIRELAKVAMTESVTDTNFPEAGINEVQAPKEQDENSNFLTGQMNRVLQYGSVAELEALLEGGMSVDQVDFQDRTALMLYCARGNSTGVDMLIRRGADVNSVYMFQDRIPKTALDAANETGRIEIAELLASMGAKTGKELRPK